MEDEFNLKDFADKLNAEYPEIYDYIFKIDGSYYIMSGSVSDFMDGCDVDKDSTFRDVYDYIVENEHLHTWWML